MLGISGCSSPSASAPSGAAPSANKQSLTFMFGSSGAAETAAVKDAAAAFSKQSGIDVNVVVASNLQQQVAQGFAGNNPPDVFYLDPSSFINYAGKGVLYPYAKSLPNANDFQPAEKAAFTYKGTFTCAPKDGGPLSLYINTDDWKAAGLTEADYPTNWSQLEKVAGELTAPGRAGLTIDPSHSELDEFLYQNGGTVFNDQKTKVELDSDQNVKALTYVKSLLTKGVLAYPSQLDASWSGEAFGKNKAAMTIVGNWIAGGMKSDYPNIHYKVLTIPAGPSGTKGTVSFTNCLAIPTTSKNIGGAVDLVKYFTSPDQEMKFSKAFGPMPSLTTATGQWQAAFPQFAPLVPEMAYAHPDIALASGSQALSAFDSALAQLKTGDPATILKTATQNMQPLLDQQNQ